MSKSIFRLLLFSGCLSLFIGGKVDGQELKPTAHPNHYILLIDASGSVMSGQKKGLYEKALFERLLQALYQDGFGETIPPYDSNQDYLTFHRFGIVTGHQENAYNYLVNYDFLTDYIHPVFVGRRGVSADTLKQNLFPAETYQYTILSWAKPLGLYRSRLAPPNDISHRTFLVIVHDGVPNENSLAEEVQMVKRWSKANFERVSPRIKSLDSDYKFTDGRGDRKPAHAEEVNSPDVQAPIFIEAYEVIGTPEAEWEKNRPGQPFQDVQLQWVKESGDVPEGMLTATLNHQFQDWMKSAKDTEVSLALEQDGRLTEKKGLEVPFLSPGALSCRARTFNAVLSVSLWQSDELLGRRMMTYTYPQMVVAPRPLRCTVGFILLIAALVVLAILIIAAVWYYIYYRFFATHLEIQIPGTLVPIPLKRRGQMAAPAQLMPQKELEALSLKLPSLFKQHLFYRGGTITLHSESEQMVHWVGENGDATLQLPIARESVPAYWNRLSRKPSLITINYQQGGQRMGLTLSYPGGASEQLEGEQT